MKTLIARLTALCAFTLIAAFPIRGQAQTVTVDGYFGTPQTQSAPQTMNCYCYTSVQTIDGEPDGSVYVESAAGSVSARVAQLACVRTSKGILYATGTAYGYWYAAGNSTGLACEVSIQVMQTPTGQQRMYATVNNYYAASYNGTQYAAGAAVYSSGNVSLLTPDGMGIEMGD